MFVKAINFFTCKHKINESNAKVTAHYWIVWFYVFIPNKFFIFFRNMFNTKTIEINKFIFITNKAIHRVPTSAYSSRFITYAPSFIFSGRLFLEKTPLILGSFWKYISNSLKILFFSRNQLLYFLFLFYFQNQLLQFILLLISFLTK